MGLSWLRFLEYYSIVIIILKKSGSFIYYLHLSDVALFIMIVSCYEDNKKTERTIS